MRNIRGYRETFRINRERLRETALDSFARQLMYVTFQRFAANCLHDNEGILWFPTAESATAVVVLVRKELHERGMVKMRGSFTLAPKSRGNVIEDQDRHRRVRSERWWRVSLPILIFVGFNIAYIAL